MEFDDDFQRLDALMSAYEQEGEAGPVKVGEQAFAWSTVIDLCEKIVQRVADVRVAIWWVQALIKERNISDLLVAFRLIDRWFSSDVIDVHPKPESDENHLEVIALNLSWLGSINFVGAMAQLRVEQGSDLRLGQLIAKQDQNAIPEQLRYQINELLEISRRLHGFLQKVESNHVYGIERSIEYLSQPLVHKEVVASVGDPVEMSAAMLPINIRSRDEVAIALNKVIGYFQHMEPGHPAPILLERVQRMLGASFQDIMKELYADASQLVSRIERPQGS